MLYLTRRPGEAVIINNAIEVRVVELKGKSVKLGFTFPSDATVLREEVYLQIKAENEAAVAASAEVLRAGAAESAASGTGTEDTRSTARAEDDDAAGHRPRVASAGRDPIDRLKARPAGDDRHRTDDS